MPLDADGTDVLLADECEAIVPLDVGKEDVLPIDGCDR